MEYEYLVNGDFLKNNLKSCIEGFADESEGEEVIIHFKTSTGGGVQLSEINFFDSDNNALSVLSSEKPETNPDGSENKLIFGRGSQTVDKTYDGNKGTKWYSFSTLGSVKFKLNGVPNYYTFTTANDNNPHNRTPVSWDVIYDESTTQENHDGKEYYTSDTQKNNFTLPANDKFVIPKKVVEEDVVEEETGNNNTILIIAIVSIIIILLIVSAIFLLR